MAEKNKGGRPAGKPNVVTRNVKELAGKHIGMCVEQLVNIAQRSQHEVNRLAAIEQLLNRACGKPSQAVVGDPTQPMKLLISWEE